MPIVEITIDNIEHGLTCVLSLEVIVVVNGVIVVVNGSVA